MFKVRRKLDLAFKINSLVYKDCEIKHTSGNNLTVPAPGLPLV